MKKIFYIICFSFLGVLLQFLIRAEIEIWYLNSFARDFSMLVKVIFLIAGALFGFWQGKYWWERLYEKQNV